MILIDTIQNDLANKYNLTVNDKWYYEFKVGSFDANVRIDDGRVFVNISNGKRQCDEVTDLMKLDDIVCFVERMRKGFERYIARKERETA